MKYKLNPISYKDLIKENSYDVVTTSTAKYQRLDEAASNQQHSRETLVKSRRLCSASSCCDNKDTLNIVFLMFLYFLQGIPLGLKASLPFILSSRQASYANQAVFSLASWPFSLKLLWAPIVDSVFFASVGRRKSWLVPIQYLIGIFMLFYADFVHDMLEQKQSISSRDINVLTSIFFLFTFLSATQDIAVDGWGLTILSKENSHWASICNNAGSTTGVLVGNSIFLILESTQFSNLYIRPYFGLVPQPYGIINLKDFMKFFGIVFIISTTLILIFKKEKDTSDDQPQPSSKNTTASDELSIKLTFKLLLKILKLSPVQKFCIILFTCKIAFATHSARYLKLIEAGVPKETLGLINGGFQILQILTPLLIGRLFNLGRPLDLFFKTYPIRMVMTVILTVLVFYTPLFKDNNGHYPLNYFIIYIILNGFYALIFSTQSLTKTAFFTQISDKTIGGTYMTLLNTVANIGMHWPSTLALLFIDIFSLKECTVLDVKAWTNMTHGKSRNFGKLLLLIDENTCSTESETNNCLKFGASCLTRVDAFYYLTTLTTFIGLFWLLWFKRTFFYLQSLPKSAWRISSVVSIKRTQLIT